MLMQHQKRGSLFHKVKHSKSVYVFGDVFLLTYNKRKCYKRYEKWLFKVRSTTYGNGKEHRIVLRTEEMTKGTTAGSAVVSTLTNSITNSKRNLSVHKRMHPFCSQ